MTIQRRSFLRGSATGLGLFTATTALGRWTRRAGAASTARYAGHRSLVGVFLLGGNDGNQVLVPRDSRYALYAAARPTIKLAQAELLPIPIGAQTTATATYGLHPRLTRLQAAFNAANPTAVLVANVGPAVRPTLKTDYVDTAFRKPTNLFSHSDMQEAWATAVPVPSLDPDHARTGWGGRTADAVEGLNPLVGGATYPAMTLVGGRRSFAASAGLPLVTSASGELAFNPASTAAFYNLRRERMPELAAATGAVDLQIAYGDILATANSVALARAAARTAAWAGLQASTRTAIEALFAGAAANWTLPAQLLTVLKDIVAGATAASTGLGLKRQVFSVGLGGFDTHAGQRAAQDDLLAQLDFSLDAFRQAMALLATDAAFGGTPPQSTLFTMSDFGRTLSENANAGTDHAWGNHMIVMGSHVDGGRIHGVFPNLDLATTTDSTDTRGRWIPSTTVDQYVFNLAAWLGVNGAELAEILPNHQAYRDDAVARGLPVNFSRGADPSRRAD